MLVGVATPVENVQRVEDDKGRREVVVARKGKPGRHEFKPYDRVLVLTREGD